MAEELEDANKKIESEIAKLRAEKDALAHLLKSHQCIVTDPWLYCAAPSMALRSDPSTEEQCSSTSHALCAKSKSEVGLGIHRYSSPTPKLWKNHKKEPNCFHTCAISSNLFATHHFTNADLVFVAGFKRANYVGQLSKNVN